MKWLIFAFVFWLAFGPDTTALTNKVLIIGIDGTMPSAVAVARTPNLDALKSNGCHSVRVVTHCDVDRAGVERALAVLKDVVSKTHRKGA